MPSEKELLLMGFSDQDRREFLAIGREKEFHLNEVIIRENTPGLEMYIIEDGEVSLWLDDANLGTLKEGDTLGASVIVLQHPRTARVVAEGYVRVREYERSQVMAYFRRKPPVLFQQFFVNVTHVLVGQLRKANQRIWLLNNRLRELELT
ncbi:MAG: cyclic nucleotide-binding domain-containing protein [Candidatus Eisenbacteria bacterium]|nr:cyclic nucleotide-binding domain-containing protein [Candidatus Eisenbacteria bacterium]